MKDRIKKIINEVQFNAVSIFGKNIDLILVGSTARNEFTGYMRNNKIYAYSDLEFVLVNKFPSFMLSSKVQEFNKRLKLLTNKHFHESGYEGIECWCMSQYFFKKSRTVFFLEAKKNGLSIVNGLNTNREIYSLVDKKDLNEILLHRAMNMCRKLIQNEMNPIKINYDVSRNFLDILTVYSMNEGKQFSSYFDRESNIKDLKVSLSNDLINELEFSLRQKIDPEKITSADYKKRLSLYWKELAKLANYLNIWNRNTKINYSGAKVFAHKSKLYLENPKKYYLRAVFIEQKKDLLKYILEMSKNNFHDYDIENSTKKFGLKENRKKK